MTYGYIIKKKKGFYRLFRRYIFQKNTEGSNFLPNRYIVKCSNIIKQHKNDYL